MYPSIFTFLLLSQTLISSITSNEYINHYIDHSDKNSLLKIDFFVIQNLSIEDDDLKAVSYTHLTLPTNVAV